MVPMSWCSVIQSPQDAHPSQHSVGPSVSKRMRDTRRCMSGMRSGQSLSISDLNLKKGSNNPVKVSLVYPADATPGHLLSVVPVTQLAMLRQREQMLEAARKAESEAKTRTVTPQQAPPAVNLRVEPTTTPAPQVEPATQPVQPTSPPPMIVSPRGGGSSLMPPAMIMPRG